MTAQKNDLPQKRVAARTVRDSEATNPPTISGDRRHAPTVVDAQVPEGGTPKDRRAAATVRESLLSEGSGQEAMPIGLDIQSFNGWQVLRLLSSEGGEADIYIIQYQGQEMVLRLYRQGKKPKPEIFSRLGEISHNLGKLVVQVVETGQDSHTGRWYEIQEYMRYGSMAQLLKGKKLKEVSIPAVAGQLSEAITALHSVGIVHRDIKPDNILIRTKKPLSLALGDFGISSMMDAGLSIKETRRANTPLYAAPESFSNIAGRAGDWWGLGVVLLEAVLGTHPLDGLSANMVMRELTTRGLPIPDRIGPETALLLKGLLTRDDKTRWRTEEVARWLNGDRNIPVFYESDKAVDTTLSKPFIFNGEQCFSLTELAEAFIRTEGAWEAAKKHLGRGHIRQWLENNNKFEAAVQLDEFQSDNLDQQLFAFVHKFKTTPGIIYRSNIMSMDNVMAFLNWPENSGQSGQQSAIVSEIVSGNLSWMPETAQRLNCQLEPMLAVLLRYSGQTSPNKIMEALMVSQQNPTDYFWGPTGASPDPVERFRFALIAGSLIPVADLNQMIGMDDVLPALVINGFSDPTCYRAAWQNLEFLHRNVNIETVEQLPGSREIYIPALNRSVYIIDLDIERYSQARFERVEREKQQAEEEAIYKAERKAKIIKNLIRALKILGVIAVTALVLVMLTATVGLLLLIWEWKWAILGGIAILMVLGALGR